MNDFLPAGNIYPWGDTCRFNSWSNRIREKFGGRIQKVSVYAGFTCPNRDGSLDSDGCIYCSGTSFVPSYCFRNKAIPIQIDNGIEFHRWRYRRAARYMAYFQPFSNTYAPVPELKKIYREALDHPMISALAVSTRPDCIDNNVLDLLEEIAGSYPVFLELGLESCYDSTLSFINRRHDFRQSFNAIHAIAKRNIPVTGHFIFGLPGESLEDMLNEASIISDLPLSAIKFHQLQVLKNTRIASIYLSSPNLFHRFSLESYIDFVIDFLERLNPSIAVERLAAETPPRFGVINDWGKIRTDVLYKKTESVMERKKTCQGNKFKKSIEIPTSNSK